MIKVTDLTKAYDKTNVLENLNCNIKDNCIYGLVGANGAGKSTLLRIINGVFRANSGKVEIDGKEYFDNEGMKQQMVFVPDDLFFFSGYTLLDTAKFYAALYPKFDMNYFNELVNKLKLDLKVKINSLSKGLKRQSALICALATKAKYMFFDETFDGLDPVVRNVVKKIIAKHMENNDTTIVMTSHNLRELEDICDNLGLLYKGGIFFESDIDTLKTNMFKVQISLKGDFSEEDFKELEILSFKKKGSVATVIIKGDREKAEAKLKKMNPVILDFLSLTLEEIFIYQMEVLGYEFNEII